MKTTWFGLLMLFSINSYSQDYSKVDILEFIKDIQVWKKQDNRMILAWWIPSEYWQLAFNGNATVTSEVKDKIRLAFKDYSLICVADINYLDANTVTHKMHSELKKSLSVVDSSGKIIPLTEDTDLPDQTFEFSEYLKPFLKSLIGKVGEGISIFYIKNIDAAGRKLLDPAKPNKFTIKLSGEEFKWSLPLPSLLEKKKCPVDKVEMKGGWLYCPFHGIKL